MRSWFERPYHLHLLRQTLRQPGARVLDVGCGNHAPSLTKKSFPSVVYHGLDNAEWNRDTRDTEALDKFFSLNLNDIESLSVVPNEHYDIVICSHVLEHLRDPEAVAKSLLTKIREGGTLYVEVPSPATVSWPSAKNRYFLIHGCLNFFDDPTHVRPVDLDVLAAGFGRMGFHVTGPRTRRFARRIALLPVYILAGLLFRRYVPATVVWDIAGFAKYLRVQKPVTSPAVGAA